jgi:hypothetical protein
LIGLTEHVFSHNKRTFIPSAIGFIATIRDGKPTTPIVVTSPIFSTPRETEVAEVFLTTPADFQANHAFTLSEFREALADMVSVLRERGDTNIHVSHCDGPWSKQFLLNQLL